jgi:MFS family permease
LEGQPGATAGDTENGTAPRQSGLKTDSTGQTVLVPQPSDDPNDPLNWPAWRRDLILLIISLHAVIASTLSPILAADTLDLSLYFRRKFTSIALLTGYQLLGVGVGGLLFVPTSRIWGKRHAFLIGSLLCIITSAWGGGSNQNYKSIIAARFFQGIALAPFEALVNAVVGDLYFVHERGKRMALTNFCVFGGSFMTPVVVGRMVRSLGWQWSFYFVSIFSGVMFVLLFLFVPEVAFRRDDRFNTDIIVLGSNQLAVPVGKAEGSTSDDTYPTPEQGLPIKPKKTFLQNLAPFDGRKTDESFIKLFFRPFPLFLHPAVLWAMLIQGTIIGWTVFLGVLLAAVLLGPPLFYNEEKTGYLYVGAFLGAIVGFLGCFAGADLIPRWMTKLNRGIYEPEFRLILVIPMLFFSTIGLFGFGHVADHIKQYGPKVLSMFFGFEVAGMVMGAVSSSLYIVDAYRKSNTARIIH